MLTPIKSTKQIEKERSKRLRIKVPTGELNINNEIKLIKSILLYADDITINSLAVTMLNVINNINIKKRSILEMINVMKK